jgi:hypothetical protein
VKSYWVMVALVMSVVGCGQLQLPKVIVVTPLNEQDILDAKAAALIAANSERVEEIDEEASVDKCLCGGTGRSGDGLGPCACPDGCSCKKAGSEANGAEIETEPAISESDGAVSESTTEPDVPDSEPTVQQQAPPTVEQNLDSINQSLSELTDHTANLAEKYTATVKTTSELEDRVAKLEAAAAAQEKLQTDEAALTKKAAETPTRPNQQLVILYADKDAATIERWEETNGAALVDVGWTIGADETFQIVKLRIESDDATKFPRAYEMAKQNGTPYFAFHYKGEFRQGQNSLPDSAVVSDRLNALVVKPVTASSTTNEEPWRYVEETWPARVPINGTRTPSKEVLVWHLRGGGTGGGNYVQDYYASWPLEQMTAKQLVTLHDADHPGPVSKTVQYERQAFRYVPIQGNVSFRQKTCRNGKCY